MGERLRADRLRANDRVEEIDRDVARSRERITSAPVVIVVCLSTINLDDQYERLMAMQSVAASIENLLLAAHEAGLGACWMAAPLYCPDVVRAVLQLPDDWEAQALITIGYPADAGQAQRARRFSRDNDLSVGANHMFARAVQSRGDCPNASARPARGFNEHCNLSRRRRRSEIGAGSHHVSFRATQWRRISVRRGKRFFASAQNDTLTVIVNTGDDFEWHGLYVCPDLDTVTYTLGGLANTVTGWGVAGDTFEALGALQRLGCRRVVQHRRPRSGDACVSHLAAAAGQDVDRSDAASSRTRLASRRRSCR